MSTSGDYPFGKGARVWGGNYTLSGGPSPISILDAIAIAQDNNMESTRD